MHFEFETARLFVILKLGFVIYLLFDACCLLFNQKTKQDFLNNI